ncbi:MAG TPA: xyloglucanase [Candidatus Acidoferrum sp.]|nr:xyloglucanase [Candidatus Acidoferrum sp.]
MSGNTSLRSFVAKAFGILLIFAIVSVVATKTRSAHVSADWDWGHGYHFRNVVIGGGGGFVPGIIFSTREPNLIYARTDIGGAYRWEPDANRWIPLLDWIGFDDWNLTGVESIAVDPLDPRRVYLAVGTYTNDWTSQNGAILRSFDYGRSFQRFDLPFKVGGNMPGRNMGERLAIDPNNNSILYLGTHSGNGLWRSVDYGQTWSKVTSFPNPGTYYPGLTTGATDSYDTDLIGVVWVTFDPRTTVSVGRRNVSQNIYVGVADLNTSVYHSADGGKTWAAIPGQPTGFMAHHGKLASTGMLYLSYNNNAGPYDGTSGDIWRYDTSSATWTRISPIPSTDTADDYFGYGGLSVDAQYPDTIVVAALNSWWPDTIFFRSLDGGSTWSRIWNWGPWPTIIPNYTLSYATIAPWLTFGATPSPCTAPENLNSLCPQPTPKLGWMVGSLEIDPFNSDHMLYGTGATIFGTSNLTAWDTGTPGAVQVSVNAVGVEETAVQDLISPPAGPHLISAISDLGGFTHNDLTQPSVMQINPVLTSGSSVDYAELAPNLVVRVGSGNGGGQNIGFSTDGGQTWAPGNSAPSGASAGTVAAAADGSRVLWAPSGGGVFFSTDSGNTWSASAGIPAGARVRSDRVNPLKFYGFANGTFYISVDGGVSFIASPASGLPPAGTSGYFKAVPGHEGDIWLAGGSTASGVYGLWHSANGGASFIKLRNVDAADNIGFGMPAAHHKYVALYSSAEVRNVRGIYRSDDAGLTWTRINDDRHQYGSTSAAITGDPRVYGRVYFSTNGRGIIYGDPDSGGH